MYRQAGVHGINLFFFQEPSIYLLIVLCLCLPMKSIFTATLIGRDSTMNLTHSSLSSDLQQVNSCIGVFGKWRGGGVDIPTVRLLGLNFDINKFRKL